MTSAILSFEVRFFEKLIEKDPTFIDALIPLAHAYTHAGEYKKGLKIDKRLARLKPTDEVILYNLACSYALLNMTDEACMALSKSVDLGYADLAHIQNDPDLDSLRNDGRFGKIIEQIKEAHTMPSIKKY